jgi:hypothetical protein
MPGREDSDGIDEGQKVPGAGSLQQTGGHLLHIMVPAQNIVENYIQKCPDDSLSEVGKQTF